MNKKDKYAPKDSVEIDHWHVPDDLVIDESHFYEDTEKKSST